MLYSGRDGIPPYRLRKQHRREMQESAKANGRVPLPHIPVSSSISFCKGKHAKCVRSLARVCSACSSLTSFSTAFIWGWESTVLRKGMQEEESLVVLCQPHHPGVPKTHFLKCLVSSQFLQDKNGSAGWLRWLVSACK